MTHLLLNSGILHLFDPPDMFLLPIPQSTFLMDIFHRKTCEVAVFTSNSNAKATLNAHVGSFLEVICWDFNLLIGFRFFSGVIVKVKKNLLKVFEKYHL